MPSEEKMREEFDQALKKWFPRVANRMLADEKVYYYFDCRGLRKLVSAGRASLQAENERLKAELAQLRQERDKAESRCRELEEALHWRSPFYFPSQDGEYLVLNEDGYSIGRFYQQGETIGHWFPSWGLKGWLPLPAASLPEKDAAPCGSTPEAKEEQ